MATWIAPAQLLSTFYLKAPLPIRNTPFVLLHWQPVIVRGQTESRGSGAEDLGLNGHQPGILTTTTGFSS